MMTERRQSKRIKIKDDAFVTRNTAKDKLGRIIDISSGGLAYHYISSTGLPEVFEKIGIWAVLDDVHLNDIHIQTVSDKEVEYDNPFHQIMLRRCGIQFEAMTDKQKDQLKSMIQSIPEE